MTNLTGTLSTVGSIYDGYDASELSGPINVEQLAVNGTTYLYVSAYYDDGVQVLSIDGSGTLTGVTSVAHSTSSPLNGADSLKVVSVGNRKFLVVGAADSDALSVFRIDTSSGSTEGHLTFVSSISGSDIAGYAGALDYVHGLTVLREGQGSALFASVAYYGDAIATFELDYDGNLSIKDAVFDTEGTNLHLDGATALDKMSIAGTTYLYVSGYSDNGITVMSANVGNGNLNVVANFTNGVSYTSLAAVIWNGERLLVAAGDGYIDVFKIKNNGTIELEARTEDGDADSYYPAAFGLITLDGIGYLVAKEQNYDRIGLYSIEDDYSLALVQRVGGDPGYDAVRGWTLVEIAGRKYLLSAAYSDGGVTVTEIGGDNDYLVGSDGADRIAGLRGDDVLAGLEGGDSLAGGAGEDVLVGAQGADTLLGGADDDVLVGGLGNDLMEGGAGADILKGGLGADMLSYAGSGGSVGINLASGAASGGHAAGDYFRGFEDIRGSDYGDTLTGDSGANRIEGEAGSDRIRGGAGGDKMFGGNGFDKIWGGSGWDRIDGNNGSDSLYGEGGGDKLNGGGGNDLLDGGTGDDTLSGNGGNDTLLGGTGDDQLTGNGGADVFVFEEGFGDDVITDFDLSRDKLDLSALDGINSLAEFKASAFNIAGDVFVMGEDGLSSIQIIGLSENDFTASNFIF
ncbi:calcium-binding protein [Mangrovicoccus sp. HB161399]|uniref:calcium-binding protein n=1 Tax=Mangrovicoccus sp. HB161399 TaxID=2720392 RepID=UPI0015539455|nr:calcium-binding protein [Mangrovicoccus sp. HB161399]